MPEEFCDNVEVISGWGIAVDRADQAGAGEVREKLGLLLDVDDLTVYASIDPRRVHTLHDLIVFGPA